MNNLIINKLPNINLGELRNAISNEYTEVACNKDHTIHFTSGYPLAIRLGYPEELIKLIPDEAIRPFAGVGYPFALGSIHEGETILDIGSGAGMDCILASMISKHKVEIYGLDMTDAMLQKSRENVLKAEVGKIKFIKGHAENIPLPSASVDTVISNGVINLCPDKVQVYEEIYRVLKPGGRFMIADVMLEKPVPAESRELIHLWTNCVAGAITKEEYLNIVNICGFLQVEIRDSYDVFSDARIARSAATFGAKFNKER